MKEYEYINQIYKEGSFSAAAKKLYVSQPALSMMVKKTEQALGITIFDRSAFPIKLTNEGMVFIEACNEIKNIEDNMKEKLTDINDLKSGNIIVSGENFVSSFIIPEIITVFSEKYNGINVELVESNSPNLRKLLLNDSIDVLLAHDFDPQLYRSVQLFEERILLAVPENNPINASLSHYSMTVEDIRNNVHHRRPAIDLSLFKNQLFLMLKSGNDMCKRGYLLCSEYGYEPLVRIELDQLITAYNLACFGMGVTFVSDILVKKAATKGCKYYALNSDNAYRKMSIGYKKNRYLNRATSAFIDVACRVYDEKSR